MTPVAPSSVSTGDGAGQEGWVIRSRTLSLRQPLIMGILNVTPDSFSDGGRFAAPSIALRHAEDMVAQGAAIVDIGGESTRPGSDPVSLEQELERVLPVVERVKSHCDVAVSVDTRRAAVARAALRAGADVINDVSALGDPEMAGVVAEAGAGLVLMHMRGTPRTMQIDPRYENVVREVAESLQQSADRARQAGIAAERIVLDPGIGFGKTLQHNLQLIRHMDALVRLGHPVLLGASRKAFLGTLLGGVEPEERAVATAAACVVGLMNGARIFRVHDVRPVWEALRVAEAIRTASGSSQ